MCVHSLLKKKKYEFNENKYLFVYTSNGALKADKVRKTREAHTLDKA